jgi:hypothetical protein
MTGVTIDTKSERNEEEEKNLSSFRKKKEICVGDPVLVAIVGQLVIVQSNPLIRIFELAQSF